MKELIRISKERRAGSLGYAEAMVNIYNKRLKDGSQNALPMQMLYTKKINTIHDNPQLPEDDFIEDADVFENEEAEENAQMNLFL